MTEKKIGKPTKNKNGVRAENTLSVLNTVRQYGPLSRRDVEGITALRGRWFGWRGIDVFPMFHPSFLLRDDSRKKGSPKDLTWQDVQVLKERLDQYEREKRHESSE